jgi:hypothetical protein
MKAGFDRNLEQSIHLAAETERVLMASADIGAKT